MAVAVEALATAKTCAVTLMWGDHFNPAVLGITGSDLHELSHDTIGLFESVNGGTPRPDNRFAKMQRWYAQQFASLLDRLRATPLGAGTLLDQSVVVWISESGTGVDHQGFYIPVVIAGRGGGRLDVGQFVEVKPHQRSNGGFVETTTIERTQGDLLQALANLWGMSVMLNGLSRAGASTSSRTPAAATRLNCRRVIPRPLPPRCRRRRASATAARE